MLGQHNLSGNFPEKDGAALTVRLYKIGILYNKMRKLMRKFSRGSIMSRLLLNCNSTYALKDTRCLPTITFPLKDGRVASKKRVLSVLDINLQLKDKF